CLIDDIKRELQIIVRSELSEILGQPPSRRGSVAEEATEVPEYVNDLHNSTFDVVIPDNPTTEFPVQRNMFEVPQNRQEVPLTEAEQRPKKSSRRQTVDVTEGNVRRSARILKRRASEMPEREAFKKPPTPKKPRKSSNKNRDMNVLQNVLKATEVVKGKKRAKSVHQEEILKIINTGNLKQLQLLSQIGLKTAFHIITHSSVSSSTEKPAEPENPIQHLQLEPTLTNLGFSPIIRRHVEQLEVRLGEKMQSILNTINGPMATPQ
uniref:Uncharacterized protein n=1 Tax=Phlebotomus papatasi TaxID=29031 RepID=A0A1B0D8D9_PHLPP